SISRERTIKTRHVLLRMASEAQDIRDLSGRVTKRLVLPARVPEQGDGAIQLLRTKGVDLAEKIFRAHGSITTRSNLAYRRLMPRLGLSKPLRDSERLARLGAAAASRNLQGRGQDSRHAH